VLTFDGPGQGSALRDQGLHFRPDWESVVAPVIDYASTLPRVHTNKFVLVGTSLGGYLAARAAAFEPRLAACILHDGVYSLAQTIETMTEAPEAELMAHTGSRWVVRNGKWTFGAADLAEFRERCQAYTLDGIVDKIACPTLVLDAETDQFFKGQAFRVFSELTCTKHYISFAEKDGGGEHCHEGAVALWHQQAFDWLDDLLAGPEWTVTRPE
jgi:dienelactone hydrolase